MPEPDRLVRLDGARNFRDLGGYHTRDGQNVRRGVLFRSDGLDGLSAADVAVVAGLGLRTVCDLRGELEAAARPDVVIDGAELIAVPMGEATADHGDLIALVAGGEMAEVTDADMADIYRSILGRFAIPVGRLVSLAADPGRRPLVFHCAAGKDRTGVAAALLLGAVGVPVDSVLDDYELTNRYRSAWRIAQLRPELAARGIDIDLMRPYFSAPRPALAAALAWLDDEYGSIEGYLLGPAEVTPGALEQLRSGLLEP
jgi:protein-tyrosine phosphatase